MNASLEDRRRWFEAWAPSGAMWSAWAKPALFASAPEGPGTGWVPQARASLPWPPLGHRSAVVVDLPGEQAALAGLSAAENGYRPVPLFNTTHGWACAIDVRPIACALRQDAPRLAAIPLSDDAPPAFLLDSTRLDLRNVQPGRYDNRWMVLPQDFPSGTRLLAAGIQSVVVIRQGTLTPREDLRAVLRMWRRDGLEILGATMEGQTGAIDLSLFGLGTLGWLTAMAAVRLGLRPSSAGGFGGLVPQPSSGG